MLDAFLKKLFCKHDYKLINEEFDLIKGKRAFVYICAKCGKEKRIYYK